MTGPETPKTPTGTVLPREQESWQLHLFWKSTVGFRLAAAVLYPINRGISKYLAASVPRGFCRCMIFCPSTGRAIMARRASDRISYLGSRGEIHLGLVIVHVVPGAAT